MGCAGDLGWGTPYARCKSPAGSGDFGGPWAQAVVVRGASSVLRWAALWGRVSKVNCGRVFETLCPAQFFA